MSDVGSPRLSLPSTAATLSLDTTPTELEAEADAAITSGAAEATRAPDADVAVNRAIAVPDAPDLLISDNPVVPLAEPQSAPARDDTTVEEPLFADPSTAAEALQASEQVRARIRALGQHFDNPAQAEVLSVFFEAGERALDQGDFRGAREAWSFATHSLEAFADQDENVPRATVLRVLSARFGESLPSRGHSSMPPAQRELARRFFLEVQHNSDLFLDAAFSQGFSEVADTFSGEVRAHDRGRALYRLLGAAWSVSADTRTGQLSAHDFGVESLRDVDADAMWQLTLDRAHGMRLSEIHDAIDGMGRDHLYRRDPIHVAGRGENETLGDWVTGHLFNTSLSSTSYHLDHPHFEHLGRAVIAGAEASDETNQRVARLDFATSMHDGVRYSDAWIAPWTDGNASQTLLAVSEALSVDPIEYSIPADSVESLEGEWDGAQQRPDGQWQGYRILDRDAILEKSTARLADESVPGEIRSRVHHLLDLDSDPTGAAFTARLEDEASADARTEFYSNLEKIAILGVLTGGAGYAAGAGAAALGAGATTTFLTTVGTGSVLFTTSYGLATDDLQAWHYPADFVTMGLVGATARVARAAAMRLPGSTQVREYGGAALGLAATTGAATVAAASTDAFNLWVNGHDPTMERFAESLQSSLAMVTVLQATMGVINWRLPALAPDAPARQHLEGLQGQLRAAAENKTRLYDQINGQLLDGDLAAAQATLAHIARVDGHVAALAQRVESFTGQRVPWPADESGLALPVARDEDAGPQVIADLQTSEGLLTMLDGEQADFAGQRWSAVETGRGAIALSDEAGTIRVLADTDGSGVLRLLSQDPEALAMATGGQVAIIDGVPTVFEPSSRIVRQPDETGMWMPVGVTDRPLNTWFAFEEQYQRILERDGPIAARQFYETGARGGLFSMRHVDEEGWGPLLDALHSPPRTDRPFQIHGSTMELAGGTLVDAEGQVYRWLGDIDESPVFQRHDDPLFILDEASGQLSPAPTAFINVLEDGRLVLSVDQHPVVGHPIQGQPYTFVLQSDDSNSIVRIDEDGSMIDLVADTTVVRTGAPDSLVSPAFLNLDGELRGPYDSIAGAREGEFLVVSGKDGVAHIVRDGELFANGSLQTGGTRTHLIDGAVYTETGALGNGVALGHGEQGYVAIRADETGSRIVDFPDNALVPTSSGSVAFHDGQIFEVVAGGPVALTQLDFGIQHPELSSPVFRAYFEDLHQRFRAIHPNGSEQDLRAFVSYLRAQLNGDNRRPVDILPPREAQRLREAFGYTSPYVVAVSPNAGVSPSLSSPSFDPARMAIFKHDLEDGELIPASVDEIRTHFDGVISGQRAAWHDLPRAESVTHSRHPDGSIEFNATRDGRTTRFRIEELSEREQAETLRAIASLPWVGLESLNGLNFAHAPQSIALGTQTADGSVWIRPSHTPLGREAGRTRTLTHEVMGHGTEQRDPNFYTLLAMAALLDRVDAGTRTGPNRYGESDILEHGATAVEDFQFRPEAFAAERPNTHRLYTQYFSAEQRTPDMARNQVFDSRFALQMLAVVTGLPLAVAASREEEWEEPI